MIADYPFRGSRASLPIESGDLFLVPSHGYITSNSITGLPRRRA